MDDIVHCTVIGVNDSFVSVRIKTIDSRDRGFIDKSNFAKKYIPDLKKEVEIGVIFQAKIIKDYVDNNYRGWELSKLY